MKVSDALNSRISCRAYLPDPVPEETVRALLKGAARAPSSGNMQPWHVYAVAGEKLQSLKTEIAEQMKITPRGEGYEFAPYPDPLEEPYKSRVFKCGEDLYATIGVTREDKAGRIAQFQKNFDLFGAPCAIFLYIERGHGPGQWVDVGMYAQSLMLLAREYGLHTCPMESWAAWHGLIGRQLQAPDNLMFYCAIALGYMDEDAPINSLRTDRAPVDEFARLDGFK